MSLRAKASGDMVLIIPLSIIVIEWLNREWGIAMFCFDEGLSIDVMNVQFYLIDCYGC